MIWQYTGDSGAGQWNTYFISLDDTIFEFECFTRLSEEVDALKEECENSDISFKIANS